MSNVKVLTLERKDIPERLRHIPDPPKKLHIKGALNLNDLLSRPVVAIVGSRKVDAYGVYVTKMLARELSEQGIIIISGMALGVDAIAHLACLEAGGTTIAVLPCGIGTLYPRTNTGLGKKIEQNGLLISENDGDYAPHEYDFLIRNRLISGLSDGIIITQAASRSGSLNTARHALEQGRTVLAVPGAITNPLCEGSNSLIKMGASPVTEVRDVLHALNIKVQELVKNYDLLAENQAELDIIKTLLDGVTDGEHIMLLTKMKPAEFNVHLTMLEIRGVISPLGANHWALK